MAYKIKKSKRIFVDFNNLESIKEAERIKKKLENQGYNHNKDINVGFDKWEMVYKK